MLVGIAVLLLVGCGSRRAASVTDDAAPDQLARDALVQNGCVVGVRCEIRVPTPGCSSWRTDTSSFPGRLGIAAFGDNLIVTITPIATDVGVHEVSLTCVDAEGKARDLSISVTVRPSDDGAPGHPVFIQPLGQGMLHYAQSPCLSIDVLVEDVDSLQVTISQDPPLPRSELVSTGPKTAVFRWCPDAAQRATTTRHVLHLVADDGDNPPVKINNGLGYYILLEGD